MSRSLRRGAVAAVLALSIAPLAAACGAGSDSQTLQVKPDSVATSVGNINVQNAYIITEPNGTGPATVTARIFNNGTNPEQLTGITVEGAAQQVKLTGSDGKTGPITIPANGSVTLGGSGNPTALLASSQGVVPGNFQSTVLNFSSTGQVSLAPQVTPATHFFQPFGPVEVTPSTPASGQPSARPSGSASAKPGTSATPSGAASGAPSVSASATR
ncbi:hypothetical protein [Streptantibioticus ferralitis]|uniref:DUF461 domain-containing protein n=1 Tax=Streptantibioticus ferralitis TaxID=236510 RepID=A0ABT5Z6K6_9ACTN|nr:hypothetical protein [Streptantibioticus ferralitis]MDF2259374.1 hypothetical protein [Streptantibioticus ferralitis]